MTATERRRTGAVWGIVAAVAAVLLIYSQTLSLTWDEGFHLIAAQLINSGKRPYVDFLFAQTPLNAYWVAFWMRVFGQSWRLVHAIAALESAAAVALIGDYVLRRFPAPEWRMPAAIAAAALAGLNVVVVEYGTLGQAYGICLLSIVAAFRFAVLAPKRSSLWTPLFAGLATGTAAASSLLTVTVAPVLLIWIWWRSGKGSLRAGNRWFKTIAFAAGVAVPFAPMIRLFLLSPGQVIFDVVKFHLYYRQLEWGGWQAHDLEVATAWLNSSQALILGSLAILGLISAGRSGWSEDVKSEFRLCGWLALSMSAYLMATHPTFPRYFLLTVPFLSIPAAAGLWALLGRLRIRPAAAWPVALLIVLMAGALTRDALEDHEDSWYNLEPIARKVAEVTPRGARLYAEEPIYFLLHRTPPPGFEWNGSHKVNLSVAEAAPLHIVPRPEVVRRIKAGEFDTAETCGEGEPEALGLANVYVHKAEVNDCFVFWERRNPRLINTAAHTGAE